MTRVFAVEELQVVGNFFLETTERTRFPIGQPMSCQNQFLLHYQRFFDINLRVIIEELQVVDHLLNMLQKCVKVKLVQSERRG